jgi:hypothetical protein
MKRKLQFAGWMMALGMSAAAVVPTFAQAPHARWAQSHQDNKPPKQQHQPPQHQPQQHQPQQHQPQQHQPPQHQPQQYQPQGQPHPNGNPNRPPESNANRGGTEARPYNNPNRPLSGFTPPPPKRFDNLNRQEQQKILENNKRYQSLSPSQKQEFRDRAEAWNKLTPAQQGHIRNDVLPRWRQMPPDRRQAIQQRLRVLQNMPESARNQRLNDPNFTRGMSEEDRATLRDLSHLHVGGPPDPPNE